MATYLKGNAVANATSYKLFELANGVYTSLAEASEINFKVSALGLAAGDHVLVVKAKADGYDDSEYSNEVIYTVEDSSGEDDTSSATSLTLYQGYASGATLNSALETRVRTDFIDGAFSITLNDGYLIRAIFEYASPSTSSSFTELVKSSELLTTYTKTSTSGYCVITFCKTDATQTISPTEDIVKSFTGTIYSDDSASGDDSTTTETIEVEGIKIAMGQILSSSLNTEHAGRAYTVDALNDKTTISTSGSSFVMIPIIDTDDDLTNGSSTLYTASDGTFNNTSTGSLQYHDTIAIADIKAVNSTANIYVMFKHSSASTFALSDLASAVTIN